MHDYHRGCARVRQSARNARAAGRVVQVDDAKPGRPSVERSRSPMRWNFASTPSDICRILSSVAPEGWFDGIGGVDHMNVTRHGQEGRRLHTQAWLRCRGQFTMLLILSLARRAIDNWPRGPNRHLVTR